MIKKLTPPSINFEASLSELEMMIEKMEKGQLTLEESLKCFEKGVSLTRECQKALREAEQKIQILIEQNGVIKAEPFLVEQE